MYDDVDAVLFTVIEYHMTVIVVEQHDAAGRYIDSDKFAP
jgi:hypothetical protein